MSKQMRERLEELRQLMKETELLEWELKKLERKAEIYRGPAAQSEEARRLCGAAEARLRERREALLRRRQRVEDEACRLVDFIDGIPHSIVRQVFMLRYLDGCTWQQVSNRTGLFTADSLRQMHNRYLDREEARAGVGHAKTA